MKASLLVYLHITVTIASINLYPDDLSPSPVNLATSCISAINATISCDSAILPLAFQDYYGPVGNLTLQSSICDSTCGTSLASYREVVVSTCGAQKEVEQGYPVTYVGDLVGNYYNLTCLRDSTSGEWCTG